MASIFAHPLNIEGAVTLVRRGAMSDVWLRTPSLPRARRNKDSIAPAGTAPPRAGKRGWSIALIATLALLPFAFNHLATEYRSLDSDVKAEPVASTEAYKRYFDSILSSKSLSPNTRQTLSPVLDGDGSVSLGEMVTALDKSQRVGDGDRWVALSELLLKQANEAAPHEADRARKLYLLSAFYAYRFLFEWKHQDIDRAFDQRYRLASQFYAAAVGQYFIALVRCRQPAGAVVEEAVLQQQFTIELEEGSSTALAREFDDYLIAREFEFRGLRNRYTRDGIGTALIGIRSKPRQGAVERFLPSGAYAAPVTVLLDFDLNLEDSHVTGRLRLYDPRLSETVSIRGGRLPLAADFTAPYAYMLSRADDHNSGWLGLLDGSAAAAPHGVLIYGAYDTEKIPVLMIHGLGDSPQSWRELTNDIFGSPELRSRYQILHYVYPTNGPVLSLARKLRHDLSEFFDVVDPGRVSPAMVVIGHSMGGLLAKSLAVESGLRIWNAAFTVPPGQLHVSEEVRRAFVECFILMPWPKIGRLIFLGVPQHGSDSADSWWAHAAAQLISRPDDPQYRFVEALYSSSGQASSQVRALFQSSRNTSIDTLSPRYPPMRAFDELPIEPSVPFHSIIGAIGDGRSDGYVSVKSAHLARAESELILPVDHRSFDQPRVLKEIYRILAAHGTNPMGRVVAAARFDSLENRQNVAGGH